MTHGSLFSGIGGFDLAASWMGWKNAFHCEIDEFCSRVLKCHFFILNIMETSRQQISRSGEARLMSSPEDSRASLSALPDEGEERRMTATSGRRCSALFGKSGRLGLSVRMLLESSRWYSPVRRLQWQARPLYSERITRRRSCVSGMSSRRSARTLSVRDIPSSRLTFRLVPSVRPTGGTGCGLLPTVMTQGLKISNEKGQTEFIPLDLLPTPNAAEGEKYSKTYNPDSQMGKGLTSMAVNGLLPTPTAIDAGGGRINKSLSPNAKNRPTLALAARMTSSRTGHASQLNPRYVAEMMGFPSGWTESPFLAGERSQ